MEEIDCTLSENYCTGYIFTGEIIVEEELVSDQVRKSLISGLPNTTDDFRPPSPVELEAENVSFSSVSAP